MSFNNLPGAMAQAIIYAGDPAPVISDAVPPEWKTDQDSGPPPPLPMYLAHICLWPGCKSAQRNFLTSHDLDFHIQTYHMRQCPWPTCVIQRSFRRKSDLLRHMESVHSGVRRFICDFPGCYTAYSRKDKLTAHKRSHFQARQKTRSLDDGSKAH
jgi:hypothetical protein